VPTPDPSARPRPRNVEQTKQRLLAAAIEEFAEHGLAGARVDRIAQRAGANKRLLYVYFGNKDEVFDAVVDRCVSELSQAAPFDARDLPGYAGEVFDFLAGHPQTRRVLAWRDCERASPVAAEERAAAARLRAVRAAQRAGELDADIPALDLLALTDAIVNSWLGASVGLRSAGGADGDAPRRLRAHRRSVTEAVRRVSAVRRS
jgi:AcrR family transcriptional regulator